MAPKKKQKSVSIPRKSQSSRTAEEKHIGYETVNWSDVAKKDHESMVFWTLRHYGYFYDIKDAVKWASVWVKKNRSKSDYKNFKASPDRFFSMTAGGLCRMIENGAVLKESQMNLINSSVDAAIERGKATLLEKKDEVGDVYKKTPADIIKEKASDFIAEIDDILDMFGTKTWIDWDEYSVYNELHKINAPYNVAKDVVEYYTPQLDELVELIEKKTPDLVEAYAFLGVRNRKKLMNVIKNIIDDAEKYMLSKKAVRKTRVKKVTSAGQQISKLKYMPESAEYKITSQSPTNIIGASEVYLFSTKYKRMTYLISSAKTGFTVKGTTIQDIDLEGSYQKTIRKPDEFLTDFMKAPKVKARKLLAELKTKAAKTNGRTSDQTIILKVY